MTPSRRVRTMALLAAALALLAVQASSSTHYFCRMMDRVVASCCCAGEGDGRARVERAVELRAPDCCERIESSAVTAPAVPETPASVVEPMTFVSILPVIAISRPPCRSSATPIREARAPPAVGPPIFLANCAFLI